MSVSGVEQVIISGADRWKARATLRVHRFDQILAMRGMMAAADGRTGTWLIPPCSGFQRIERQVNGINLVTGMRTIVRSPFDDGSTFSDTGEFETKMILGSVTAVAASRSRSITVQMPVFAGDFSWDFSNPDFFSGDDGSGHYTPLAGQFFSIGEYLYVIATAIPVHDPNDGVYTLAIRPGLRIAANVGDQIDFSRPVCRMRLATDETGELDLDMLRFANVSLDFVEDPVITT